MNNSVFFFFRQICEESLVIKTALIEFIRKLTMKHNLLISSIGIFSDNFHLHVFVVNVNGVLICSTEFIEMVFGPSDWWHLQEVCSLFATFLHVSFINTQQLRYERSEEEEEKKTHNCTQRASKWQKRSFIFHHFGHRTSSSSNRWI